MMNAENIFQKWLIPISLEKFRQEYLHQKYLHCSSKKSNPLLSWTSLNRLLDQTAIWSFETLKLYLNTNQVPIEQYCTQTANAQGQMIYRPYPKAVQHWLSQGASIVLNDIETLTPEISSLAYALKKFFGGRLQTNLYASLQPNPAFASHFDVHDVFVFQTQGQKKWHLYQQRVDAPIAHPKFNHFTQEQHEQAKGPLMAEIILKAGDFLYIPRGFYHDALATEGPSLHITFGLTKPIGLDVISLLFEAALEQSSFRQYLDPKELSSQCSNLAHLLTKTIESNEFQKSVSSLFQSNGVSVPYKLPKL